MPSPRKFNKCKCGEWKRTTSKTCKACRIKHLKSPEHRAHISKKLKGKPKPKGWKHSRETKAKMRAHWTKERREQKSEEINKFYEDPENRKLCSLPGEKNPRWLNGESQTQYAPGFGRRLKKQIRERDNFTCQLCGITEEETGVAHSIHHIDYTKTNHDPDNLATTCKGCNSRVNSNRDVWYSYFFVIAEGRRHLGQDINKLIGRKVVSQKEGFIVIDHV